MRWSLIGRSSNLNKTPKEGKIHFRSWLLWICPRIQMRIFEFSSNVFLKIVLTRHERKRPASCCFAPLVFQLFALCFIPASNYTKHIRLLAATKWAQCRPPSPHTDKTQAEKQRQEVRCVICRTSLRPKQGDGVTRCSTNAENKDWAPFFSFKRFSDRTACDGCRRAQVWRGSRWKHKSSPKSGSRVCTRSSMNHSNTKGKLSPFKKKKQLQLFF